jgi:hypothetical protein
MRTRFAVAFGAVVLASLGWSTLATAAGEFYVAQSCSTPANVGGGNCRTDAWELPSDPKAAPARRTSAFCGADWISTASKVQFTVVSGRYGTDCTKGLWRLGTTGVDPIAAPLGARGAMLSADDRRIAYVVDDFGSDPSSTVWVADVDGGNAQKLHAGRPIDSVRWTADGRIVFREFFADFQSVAAAGEQGSGRLVGIVPNEDVMTLAPDLSSFALRHGSVLAVGSLRGKGGSVLTRVAENNIEPVWLKGAQGVLYAVRQAGTQTAIKLRVLTERRARSRASGLSISSGLELTDAASLAPVTTTRPDVAAPAVVLLGDSDAAFAGPGRGGSLTTPRDRLFAAVVDPAGIIAGQVEVRRGTKVLRKLGFYDNRSLSAALQGLKAGRYRVTFRVTDGAVHTATVTARVRIVD